MRGDVLAQRAAELELGAEEAQRYEAAALPVVRRLLELGLPDRGESATTASPWRTRFRMKPCAAGARWAVRAGAPVRARARNTHAEAETVVMVVLRREETWRNGRRRLRLRLRGLARLRIPVLVVAAALFGAAVSAAVLVSFWDKESGRRRAVETKLAASGDRVKSLTAANSRLQEKLASTRATSQRVELSSDRLRSAARKLLVENRALTATASRLHGRGGSLEDGAASVSKLAATLGSDLVAVLHYITNTSAGSLDPSYLKAQLDYLKPAVEDVRSAAAALGSDAGSYASSVDAFSAQAADYAAALQRLARERDAAGSN